MRQVGLIGFPVAHSLSPRMQQAAFDACGIAARYALWETAPADLPARIASLRASEILGANVTIPYKTAALEYIDGCDPLAARVGAINTIVTRDGRLIGYNTDVGGLMQALAANKDHPFHSQGKSAIILGTGGAARAAAVGLLEGNVAELIVLGRNKAHADAFLEHLQASADACSVSIAAKLHAATLGSPEGNEFLARADLLVNATPVGLHKADRQILVDVDCVSSSALVMDMIFNPPHTPLLRAAQAHGCATLNGLSMLLYQGALAFELWTGQPTPLAVMQRALGLS
ncbi:MAG TPA: shikimate dehydrogenase [Ktedonobacterales bacterium]|nr:shikimate dehydrogenase [Ktedonobacterales bacterium]